MDVADPDMLPLAVLLSAYAGGDSRRHRALWAFDARLVHVARTTREPMIGQMRLAWWNEVLADPGHVKGTGEPVVDALRATGAIGAPGLVEMIEGWEILAVEPEIDRPLLADYARGRGGGLFKALAGAADVPAWLPRAGQVWALWDLAGHCGDEALARAAVDMAVEVAAEVGAPRWPAEWRPLRIAFTLARQDVGQGRGAPSGLPRGLVWRLWRIALVGR
ncbi:hypothetical protein [Sphingobium ummariense]